MAQSVTMSSAGTATLVLNPVARATTVQLTATSASSGVSQIEISLDDPTLVGGPTATWSLLSSGTAMQSSNVTASGLVYTVLSPVGGVRLNSSVLGVGGLTLKALQSVTA